MNETNDVLNPELQKKTAASLFNHTWELLDLPNRTIEQIDEMINAAHASCYHWLAVGEPINQARGHWQISRVYSIANRSEPANYHAQRCLELCNRYDLGAFDTGFAYEALARAALISMNKSDVEEFVKHGLNVANDIESESDKEYLVGELTSIRNDI